MYKYKNFISYNQGENFKKQSEKSFLSYIKIFLLINIILLSFNISTEDKKVTEKATTKEIEKEEVINKKSEMSEALIFINNHGTNSEIKDGTGIVKIKTLDSLKELSDDKSYNIVKGEGDKYEVIFE